MERMIQWLWGVVLICSVAAASAQTVQPSETLTELSKGRNCSVYTFNYPSVNAAGEAAVLSSALFAWTPNKRHETDSIESLHIYCHVTITSDAERPTSTDGASQEHTLLTLFPGRDYGNFLTGGSADYVGRCIVIAPDYEGYGVTKDVPHPYLSERLTAQQVTDAVTYGLALYQKESRESATLLPLKSDWRSFSIGFSQGGSVSLATHRYIEEEGLADDLHFQGSFCGAGPYDKVTTIRYYFEDDGTSYGVQTAHKKGMVTYPIVMPLILKSMCETHPDMAPYRMEDLLSQQLLDTGVLDWIDSKAYTSSEIIKKWYEQLQQGLDGIGSHYTPEQMGELFESPKADKVWCKADKMFTSAFNEYMNDISHFDAVPEEITNAPQAIHRALADNSLITGWEPQHRIQFFHSKSDMVVPYGNYLSFRDAHSYGEGDLFRVNDTFSKGDHVDSGIDFLVELFTLKTYAKYFNWICEGPTTVIDNIQRPMEDRQWSMINGQWSMINGQWLSGWYTLDGRRLTAKPTARGVYIHDGRKTVVQ